jgi:hypothetical protein
MGPMSRLSLLFVLVAAAALAGCGGDGESETTTTTLRSSLSASNGEELEHDESRAAQGVEGDSVCELIPTADVEKIVDVQGLKPQTTDSLDLSTCRYSKGETNVRVILDGAADATRRYFNQQAEAYQKFNTIPSLKPHNVRHVGDDSTYGNAGAYWTKGRAQLVAFKADRIARVTVYIPGQPDARRKGEAADLAKLLFDRMKPEQNG